MDAPAHDSGEHLISELTNTLASAGIYVNVELSDGVIMLSGEVDSPENREAVIDVATALGNRVGLTVDASIDLVPSSPDLAFANRDDASESTFRYLDPDRDDNSILDPGFEGDADFAGSIGTTDSELSVQEAIPYYPATDPVAASTNRMNPNEGIGIAVGLGASSMDITEYGEDDSDIPDDTIQERVLEALRADSMTTDLDVHVIVRNGVVHLGGEVETFDDAENAEAVAAEVDGVREVREEFHIMGLMEHRNHENY